MAVAGNRLQPVSLGAPPAPTQREGHWLEAAQNAGLRISLDELRRAEHLDSALRPSPPWDVVLQLGSAPFAKRDFQDAMSEFLRVDPAGRGVSPWMVWTRAKNLLLRLQCIREYDAEWLLFQPSPEYIVERANRLRRALSLG